MDNRWAPEGQCLILVSSVSVYISSCIRHQSCTLRKGSDVTSVTARSTALLLRLSRHSNRCGLRPIYCTNIRSWHCDFTSFSRLQEWLCCDASGTRMQGISESAEKCGEAIIGTWKVIEQRPRKSREGITKYWVVEEKSFLIRLQRIREHHISTYHIPVRTYGNRFN